MDASGIDSSLLRSTGSPWTERVLRQMCTSGIETTAVIVGRESVA